MKIEISGTTKQSFNIGKNVSFYFINCVQYAAANSTTRTISGVGKVLFRTNGICDFTPVTNYSGTWKIYTNNCGLEESLVEITQKTTTPEPVPTPIPTPTTPSYSWFGGIGNTSSLDYGKGKFKALRSPTGVVELNGYVYASTGFVEGNSSIFKTPSTNPTIRTEILSPVSNDFTLEISGICTDGTKIYAVGFDPYGYESDGGYSSKIDCVVIGIQNDVEATFTNGKSFRCTYQTTPYKSGIGIETNNKSLRPKGISVDSTYIYVYFANTVKSYNKLTGAFVSQSSYAQNFIAQHTKNGVTLTMTDKEVTYNSIVLCRAQSSAIVDNYTYTPRDFTSNGLKGSVFISDDGSFWIVDAGNSRILHYTSKGIYINQIAYVPMNYNASVNKSDPTRVYAGALEYKIEYPSLKWTLVANWTYGLGSNFLISDNRYNFLREVVTVGVDTFGLIDEVQKVDGNDERTPVKVKLTPSGLVPVKRYDLFSDIHFDKYGNEYQWERALDINSTAKHYKNGTLSQSVVTTSTSALSIANAFHTVTEDGHVVIYNPNVVHTGYHLSWVKGGKVIYNAMPSKTGSNRVYPAGDAFEIGQGVEFGGADRVYSVGNKIFVMYIGEFFGGAGGQTTIFFVYENGKLLTRGGKTYWEAIALDGTEAPREFAGNAKAGGVVLVGDTYYFYINCEHTGALQVFSIKGI